MKPIVSVVIPTHNRPHLVKRAVMNALMQSLKDIEVIVVIDGVDENTSSTLSQINDSRLQIIGLPTNHGACFARHIGVQSAVGEWIAFLDDDDEWMPQKLELQLSAAKASKYKFPIISSYLIAKTPQGEEIYPRRLPRQSEHISEYLFIRNGLFQGEGLVQTSTILTRKELLYKVPFCNTFKKHDDWDWLLSATATEDVGVEFVPEILSIWHLEQNHKSLSRSGSWEISFNWIQSKRDSVTPRAYSSFILAEVSARAAVTGDWKILWQLLKAAFQFGKPQPIDICLCFGMWIFPQNIRGKLRNIFQRQPQIFSTHIKHKGA